MKDHDPGRTDRRVDRRRSSLSTRRPRWRRGALIGVAIAAAVSAAAVPIVSARQVSPVHHRHERAATRDSLGIRPGKVKHVWLIILENKSYDATFTGLNNNTYLWKTLPAQGVLLKNYYGTGHFSLDNYISMVSGQATQPDTQDDCPSYDAFSGTVDTKGSLFTNPQLRSDGIGSGRQRGRRLQRLRVPVQRADAVQPARRRRRQLEGLRPGSR